MEESEEESRFVRGRPLSSTTAGQSRCVVGAALLRVVSRGQGHRFRLLRSHPCA